MSAPTQPEVPEAVTYREIREILRTFRDSGWTGMTVELHGMRITVGKHGPPASRGPAARESGFSARRVGAAAPTAPTAPTAPPASPAPAGPSGSPVPGSPAAGPASATSAPTRSLASTATSPPVEGGVAATTGCVAVRSPAVGAFWVAPSPGQPPFVQAGHEVAQDEQLAIVEVMKLMNPVVAPVAGTVVQVCAANAELVEYEQVLFWIRPGDE